MEKLKAERDALWAATNKAHDGVAVLDSTGLIVFSNPAFEKFCLLFQLGSGQKELNFFELIAKKDPSIAETLKNQISADGEDKLITSEISFDEDNQKDTNSARYFELTLSSASSNSLDNTIVWLRNITTRKIRERFQRDLLSTTSHDLKGPLGAILTSAELIEGYTKDKDQKTSELSTRIASCARNCISIIDELLSARRIQDGVMVLRPNWYNVSQILEDLVLDYLPTAKSKSIEFSHASIDPTLKIYADRIALNRVLGNLVSNAIKYTPTQGRVKISAKAIGKTIKIAVSDTGSGISPEVRHNLFERYSRLKEHSDTEGTGLGLFVAKNIMDAHNGRIEVHSILGLGTTFSVIFPCPEG